MAELSDRDFRLMDFHEALRLAVELSGKPPKLVGDLMGYKDGTWDRIYSSPETYCFGIDDVPRFCAIVGNTLLPDWMHVKAHELGVQHAFPTLDVGGLLRDLNALTRDLGATAAECESALESGKIDKNAARRLRKRLRALCSDAVHTDRGLRSIANGNGTCSPNQD